MPEDLVSRPDGHSLIFASGNRIDRHEQPDIPVAAADRALPGRLDGPFACRRLGAIE